MRLGVIMLRMNPDGSPLTGNTLADGARSIERGGSTASGASMQSGAGSCFPIR